MTTESEGMTNSALDGRFMHAASGGEVMTLDSLRVTPVRPPKIGLERAAHNIEVIGNAFRRLVTGFSFKGVTNG